MTFRYIVKLYEDRNGKIPYLRWFDKLKIKRDAARIEYRIRRIETDGNFGIVKPIGEGIYEFKFYFGPGYRVYFGRENERIILLLSGGGKETQERDIKKAKRYWKDYKERKDDDEFSRFTH